jgi:hypothetical protein
LGTSVAGLLAAIFFIVKNPTSWLISHLTLDPSTGYFRLYVFDYEFSQIAIYLFKGWGFGSIGSNDFLGNTTVDCVWIVCALRFGLPMIFFLFLTNIGAYFRLAPRSKGGGSDPYIDNAGTAFTFAITCFMGIGLTVHYWNAIWMLWAVCLGVRASIKESQIWPNPTSFRNDICRISAS